MNKLVYEGMDLDLYYEKMDNGLDVYVIPLLKLTKMYATFTTKFGSIHNAFKLDPNGDYVTVSDGVAHFLEHKMFENEDGVDPFTFFGKSGTDTNANTWFYRTTYLFKGRDNFQANLNYLLDFVQQPYLTDENVQKEKGIIVEEVKMYLDHPYWRLHETVLANTFVNNPIGIPVGGTVDTVNNITKEELINCYNTFYHPSNMMVVVSGPVDPEEVIEIIRQNQASKHYEVIPKIEIKPFDEPDKVEKEFEEIKMDVQYAKAIINFKINYESLNMKLETINNYFSLFLAIKFGGTSLFTNQLIDDQLIIGSLDYETTTTKKHIVLSVAFDSEQPEKVLNMIKEEILNFDIDEHALELKKRVLLAHLISSNEKITIPNERVFEKIVQYDDLSLDTKTEIDNMNIKEMLYVLNNVDFSNSNIVIVRPINE